MCGELICFRLLGENHKDEALCSAVLSLAHEQVNPIVFELNVASLATVPGAPFAYWVPDSVRSLFKESASFESEGHVTKQGLVTGDDFRFLRTWWEVAPECFLGSEHAEPNGLDTSAFQDNCLAAIQNGRRWVPFLKGGGPSRFFKDVDLVVGYSRADQEGIKEAGRYGRGATCYFRSGLTWPLRTNGLSFRVFPVGCIFGHKGPALFTNGDQPQILLALVALLNSPTFGGLVATQLARVQLAQSFEVGLIQQTPIPIISGDVQARLANLSRLAWTHKRALDIVVSTSHAFVVPMLLIVSGETLAERILAGTADVEAAKASIAAIEAEMDETTFRLYGLDDRDRAALSTTLTSELGAPAAVESDAEYDPEETMTADAPALVADLLAYAMGAAFGRWDVGYARGDRSAPPMPDPFSRLPICSPGMLQNDAGLPLTREDEGRLRADGRWQYPLEIPWQGVLVDDPGPPLDIEALVRHVFEIVWSGRADAIEREACQMLNVKTLRDYFRKPANFFAEHLSRYSKSRRQAPIYWPLSTPSGSYTLWLYYHRLTDQTLYTCVNDFVEPKLRQVAGEIQRFKTAEGRGRKAEKEYEELTQLELELKDFRDELLRLAKFWKPNLNDGVQITAAPLWKLFQYRPWQKKVKETWESLEAGEYDWAHLAYSIWPDRVREKCRTDKSLAIAHGLEELYQEPEKPVKKKREKKKAGE